MRSGSRRVPDLSRALRTGTGQEAGAVDTGTPGTGATEDEDARGRDRAVFRARMSESLAQGMFIVPAVAYLLMFFGYPIVKNIVMSFQQYTPATFSTGVAPFVGLEN
jgi:multiple sugar transport system permease protein